MKTICNVGKGAGAARLLFAAGLVGLLLSAGLAAGAAPPDSQALNQALSEARESLKTNPLPQKDAAKLGPRLGMLFCARNMPLKIDKATLKLKRPPEGLKKSVPRLSRINPSRLKDAGLVRLKTGAEGVQRPGRVFRFENIGGQLGIGVVVTASSPGVLPLVAKAHGARIVGKEFAMQPRTFMVVPVANVRALLADPDVKNVRAPFINHPMMDKSLPETHTDIVHNQWGYHGKNAIYAGIDTGIDWSSADFKNPDGTTRILYIWDQTDSTGPGPSGFGYGTLWTAQDINNSACAEADSNSTDWGHGTATSGVGAGNGLSTGGVYDGQADQAGIILVKSDLTDAHIEDALQWIISTAQSLNKPVSINMSFGNGWGPHDGSDELSYYIDNTLGVGDGTQGVSLSAAAGNDSGNNMHAGGPICQEASRLTGYNTDDTNVVAYSYNWNGSGYQGEPMYMEFYAPASANIQVNAWIPYASSSDGGKTWQWGYTTTGWVNVSAGNDGIYSFSRDTHGQNQYDSFVGDITTSSTSNQIGVYLEFEKPMTYYSNSSLQYIYVAYDYATTRESRNFGGDLYQTDGSGYPIPIVLQFREDGGAGSGARLDGYIPTWYYGYFASETNDCINRYLGGDDAMLINGPAAAHNVIAVGAYTSRTSWVDSTGTTQSTSETLDDLASYSSHGPLRGVAEGNSLVTDQKPNITAPGEAVVTTLSSQLPSSFYTGSAQNYIVQESPPDQHIAMEGTSFSSPQVAGAAAILLGADPTLTLGEVRNDLQNGARSDSFTGTTPNDLWGFGKLTLDSSFSAIGGLVYRGTDPSNLAALQGVVGTNYTDSGAAGNSTLYFYRVGRNSTLHVQKQGNDVVLSW
ncbi:MAG: S8 family serine peptidase [Acidobacteriota bacterium]